mgnify:CR=1 FL=1
MVDIEALIRDADPPYLANKNWKPGKTVYYSGPYWDNKELEVAVKSLLAGNWLPSGGEVNKFERKFSKQFGKKYSLMVNSGSSALILALKVMNFPKGSEIIAPCLNFGTAVSSIMLSNLKPIFVDMNPDNLSFNSEI